MGRTFETLRRREVPHPPVELPRPPAPVRVSPIPASDPEMEFGGADVPFIEVGGAAPEAHVPLQAESMPLAVAQPGAKDAQDLPGGIRFVPRPALPASAPSEQQRLTFRNQPKGAEAEQYRQIRDALQPALVQSGLRSMLLIPANERVGCTALLNLALAFTEDGERSVLVIDADVHSAAIATALELALAPGWAELLVGLPLAQALQDAGFGRLHVIAAGNRLVEGTAVLHGERVRAVLEECTRRYHLVLVQSPTWSDAAEVGTLARACDAICIVKAAADAIDLGTLQRQGLRVLGTIVTSG
jgi:Mrp family chromosome partitioning ATPase